MKIQLLFSAVLVCFVTPVFAQQKHQVQAQFNTTCETLSISQLNLNQVQLYPNPVKETLFFSSKIQVQKVVIYNMMGKAVKSFSPDLQTNAYDVSDLISGIYIVVIETPEQSHTYKIIVE